MDNCAFAGIDKLIESINSINQTNKWNNNCPRRFNKNFNISQKSELKC